MAETARGPHHMHHILVAHIAGSDRNSIPHTPARTKTPAAGKHRAYTAEEEDNHAAAAEEEGESSDVVAEDSRFAAVVEAVAGSGASATQTEDCTAGCRAKEGKGLRTNVAGAAGDGEEVEEKEAVGMHTPPAAADLNPLHDKGHKDMGSARHTTQEARWVRGASE